MWEFQDYVTSDGKVPVEDWCNNQLSAAERAEFDVAVDYLRRIEDWDSVRKSKRKYRQLTRELEGLTEIKFDVTTQKEGSNTKKRFRPVGILKREEQKFIFLGGFQKSQKGPVPEDAFEKLLKRKQDFENNRGSTREHKT